MCLIKGSLMCRHVLLLTACIDPSLSSNRWLVINDKNERLQQYLNALEFYIAATNVPICFVDNSAYDISELPFVKKHINSGRLEVLTFLSAPSVREKGKGTGEQDIIRYACENSQFIRNADYIIKITGRIIINDIKKLFKLSNLVTKSANKWVIGEKLFKAEWIQSYCFIAHKDFFNENFFKEMVDLSENDEDYKSFEMALYNSVRNWVGDGFRYYNWFVPLNISGVSAGNGLSYNHSSLREKIKCMINAFKCNLLNKL